MLIWGAQKISVWVDEDNFTIHYNMGLVAKVGLLEGKVSLSYGSGWEEYLNWQGSLAETVQKANGLLERSGAALGKGKGLSKGKTTTH